MKIRLWPTVFLAAALGVPGVALGCPMCRDTTAGSAPQVQRGLRRAIPVLGIPAGGVFLGILFVAFRTGPRDQDAAADADCAKADGDS
jgi:hypothetical protein